MTKRRIVDDIPTTPHFDFLYGRYHLSPTWTIPYFSTIMPLKHVADHLKLAVDFPGSDRVQWPLDELYQREIDWIRVERNIVPYLRASDQPQFFNSLTIALLPMAEGGSSTARVFGAEGKWRTPQLGDPDRFMKIVNAGPITCGFWLKWETFAEAEARTGQLRWNPEEVFAVALDGQHRLAAIQEFVRTPVPTEQMEQTSIPVIFLVLSPDVGYVAADDMAVVDVLRKVFIDLNKHAKVPSRTRQILLDDKEPTSVCVRALVGKTLCDGVKELDATPPRLPLSLVDWHTEQAKFDDGPYVTTILIVDWAIANILGARPIQDFTDYRSVRKQLGALEHCLDITLVAARKRLDNLENVQLRPFNYAEESNNNELSKIAHAFEKTWNRAFVRLLTEFSPYRDLIQSRRENGTFSLDFSNWYRLRYQYKRDRYAGRATSDYKQFLGRLDTREDATGPVGEGQLEAALSDIQSLKTRNLAFNVVFQRAYFLAFDELCAVKDWDLEELDDRSEEEWEDEDEYEEEEEVEDVVGETGHGDEADGELAARITARSTQFVECMNVVVDAMPDILNPDYLFGETEEERERFWLGTLLKAEGGIDFTQGASRRAQEVLYWLVAMQLYDDARQPEEVSDFEAFWDAVLEEDNSFTKRLRRSIGRFANKEVSAGGRILKAQGKNFDEDASWEQAKRRMRWVWQELDL